MRVQRSEPPPQAKIAIAGLSTCSAGQSGGSKGRIKGVDANSPRNLAEIGNQPVDATRPDPRGSLGGRGRVPRGTVPGGLNPHSGAGSGGSDSNSFPARKPN